MRILLLCINLILCSFALAENDPENINHAASLSLRVVTTTGMIADATRRIGGDRLSVTGLMGEGVDPHLYKPSPGDIRLLSQADLVLYNGLHLEGRMADMLHKLSARKPVYPVADALPKEKLRSPPEFQGAIDPHVWFDVSLWMLVGENICSILSKHDPQGEIQYREQWGKYRAELESLHTWTHEQIASIPRASRVLITAHDAFGYFGKAYDIEVLALQGLSTESEPSIADITHLISILVTRKIRALFVESSVPHKAVEALREGAAAKGHSVAIGGELFSDALGAPQSPEGTYIGMVRHNVRAIVSALSSDASAKGTP